jgi:hypothetical protein
VRIFRRIEEMTTRQTIESFLDAALPELAGKLDIHAHARDKVAADFAAAESQAPSSLQTTQGAIARTLERKLRTNAPHSSASYNEGCKDVRMDLLGSSPTQVLANAQYDSYKPENRKSESEMGKTPYDAALLWKGVQADLKQELPQPSYETWIAPCKVVSVESGKVTLAVESEFNRDLIAKRWQRDIAQRFSILADEPMKVLFVVDQSLYPVVKAASQKPQAQAPKTERPQYPMAAHQNPNNCPRVAALLERYGDMRQVILKAPLFKTPCTPEAEGGWGLGVGALIKAGKDYTLERVIWAMEQAKSYRGAKTRGAVFYHALRNGWETDR